ncbi:putative acetyltransferase [Cercophora samala]|uniref:Acetyltransferase n=1 Tax=Cercophora samala TaxID=330535 RepID=A0AA40D721_9PEZI|nr:putative acetyltransferase [Cercophora samala]
MKLNEHIAISTPSLLLVPYEAHHVPTYHQWMQDPEIQSATASEPLTLEEEYENQLSWRTSTDKLTFIICSPLPSSPSPTADIAAVVPDDADTPGKMLGDVNLFLYPYEEEEDEEEFSDGPVPRGVVGEVDIMIADKQNRGRGLGEEVVRAFVGWVWGCRGEVVGEYLSDKLVDGKEGGEGGRVVVPELRMLMVKIGEGNEASLRLFRDKLGWEQEGGRNYFGEVKFVLRDVGGWVERGKKERGEVVRYERGGGKV